MGKPINKQMLLDEISKKCYELLVEEEKRLYLEKNPSEIPCTTLPDIERYEEGEVKITRPTKYQKRIMYICLAVDKGLINLEEVMSWLKREKYRMDVCAFLSCDIEHIAIDKTLKKLVYYNSIEGNQYWQMSWNNEPYIERLARQGYQEAFIGKTTVEVIPN